MPKILFIASHRFGRSPGQRFRFEQYFSHLEENGYTCELSPLVNEDDDRILYKKGHYFEKLRFIHKCFNIRRRDVKRMNEFDIIFIFREALMTRSTWFERQFAQSRAKIVFDFDDSIWLQNVSDANRRWSWVKDPKKTPKLIRLSDMVFAGNGYLADYARNFNGNVKVVPTTIDTEEYRPVDLSARSGPVCIGWSGSITTIQHFQYAIPALRAIKEKYGDRVSIRVIGDGNFADPSLGITGMPWRKETELEDLSAIDIGIMPLPDDEWARGKCGLKGLQYMGLGIPPILSPVGVNTRIIHDGKNGFLAGDTEDWVEKISHLVEDREARVRIGAAARRSVEEHWSVRSWRNDYLKSFNDLLRR